MIRLVWCAAVIGLLLEYGCSSSVAPSAASLTGSWLGSTGSTALGTGSLNAAISQSGSDLAGTWNIAFPNGASDGGALTGRFAAPNVTLTLRSVVPQACGYLASAVLTGNRMSGTYTAFGCEQALSGPFELAKR